MPNLEKYQPFIEDNFRIINKEAQEVPFMLNEAQEMYSKKATNRDIILKARQMGFSAFILAVFAADFILKPNTWNVVVADIESNASDLLDRVKQYIRSYEQVNNVKVPLKYNSRNELYNKSNNSRYIIGTAKSSEFGRSKTITNLHLSEAAFYPNLAKILKGAGNAVTPNGRVILETTANGYNEFKQLWDETKLGNKDFEPHFFKASFFYTPKELETKHRQALSESDYLQEYPERPLDAFQTSARTYFDADALRAYDVRSEEPKENKNGFRRYRDYKKGEFILVAADTSSGGGDYCAVTFLSKTHLDMPNIYHSEVTASSMTPILYEELNKIHKETGVKPVVAYETNNGGVFELQRLATLNREGHYNMYTQKKRGTTAGKEETPKYGFSTNSATRPAILQQLKDCVDGQLIDFKDKPFINELFSFIVRPSGRAEAENSTHDDIVMSTAIAWEMYQTELQPNSMKRKIRAPKKVKFHV